MRMKTVWPIGAKKARALEVAHLRILLSLRYPSGLFAAARPATQTGYDKSWLRDNFYESLAFIETGRPEIASKALRAMLHVLLKHEKKIDAAISEKPASKMDYIHARYHPETFEQFWEDWGNKQNDAVGAILFLAGTLARAQDAPFVPTLAEKRILQKLVRYLASIEYWHDDDSGMWEENEELHSSSLAACLSGLRLARAIPGILVPDYLLAEGESALLKQLPRESPGKFVDLALLSVVWPYAAVNPKRAREILANVEYHLVRARGLIRYKGDYYYNKNPDGKSEEAEWCMGFAWLSIIYAGLGERPTAKQWLKRALATANAKGEIPELYFSNSDRHNDNTPLGWAESLLVIALRRAFE